MAERGDPYGPGSLAASCGLHGNASPRVDGRDRAVCDVVGDDGFEPPTYRL